MAKNPASYQKRQRELDKKRKADDKRRRREAQKNKADIPERTVSDNEDDQTAVDP